jgi:hypothetical protein
VVKRWTAVVAGSGLLALVACAPSLNWREWPVPGTAALALFPCKPISQTRELALAGQRVLMHLHSCDADDAVWAVATAQFSDPALVAPALTQLRAQSAQHIGATPASVRTWAVPGATPNPATGRVVLRGQLPDGRGVVQHQGLFVYGMQVFQATVMGAQLDDGALAPFFEGLRVRP